VIEPKSQSFLMKCKAWLDRTDPRALELEQGSEAERAERKKLLLKQAEEVRAHDVKEIEAQWAATGMAPPRLSGVPVSMELARIIGAMGETHAAADAAA
jgi:hypothetical protein